MKSDEEKANEILIAMREYAAVIERDGYSAMMIGTVMITLGASIIEQLSSPAAAVKILETMAEQIRERARKLN